MVMFHYSSEISYQLTIICNLTNSKYSSMNNINKRVIARNDTQNKTDEPSAIDEGLLDLVMSAIDETQDDEGSYESNMVAAVDMKIPDGVRRMTSMVTPINIHRTPVQTRSVERVELVSYVSNKQDDIYNDVNSFSQELITFALDELKNSPTDILHPISFVRIVSKINVNNMRFNLKNKMNRASRPFQTGKIFFNNRDLNDLRIKAKDIKEYIKSSSATAEGTEFMIYGLLAHLNKNYSM